MTPHPMTLAIDQLAAALDALDANRGGMLAAAARQVVDAYRAPSPAPTDLPYEDVPGGPIPTSAVDLTTIADHVTIAALGTEARLPAGDRIAVARFTFAQGRLAGPPVDLATVTLAGTADLMRKTATLARDTLNRSANIAERPPR